MIKISLARLIKGLRPLLGPDGCCIFALTCTDYAIEQLKSHNLFKAIWLITKRVLSCQFLNLF